jgi:hypothetical protein
VNLGLRGHCATAAVAAKVIQQDVCSIQVQGLPLTITMPAGCDID